MCSVVRCGDLLQFYVFSLATTYMHEAYCSATPEVTDRTVPRVRKQLIVLYAHFTARKHASGEGSALCRPALFLKWNIALSSRHTPPSRSP